MTAVASPPSLQTLSRLGWTPSTKSSPGGLDTSTSAGEVSRGFASRKAPQRTNSSPSIGSTVAASSSSVEAAEEPTNLDSPIDSTLIDSQQEREARISTTSGRTLWGLSKGESTAATSTGRGSTLLPSGGGQNGSAPPTTAATQTSPLVASQKQMQAPQQLNGGRMAMQGQQNADPPVLLVLLPMNGTFERKQITVPYFPDILRIGRQTNAKTVPTPVNGYFDSKVLSRQHAEVWADRSGKVWIRDVKSSNGTFVNGVRLSPESRDSEPHELRENDMLELGIDIVSEDQKSIVHHKVSAKIEHAGVQNNSSSVLDLNLGDIDPGSGGGLMGGLLPQSHMRGRAGSQGSMMSNGSRMSQSLNGNMSAMGVQRHMNAWLSPVSIEQVVKRLGNELKAARQQAQDLHRTSDYFNAVLNAQPGQELPKPPAGILPPAPQTNGVGSPKKGDSMSPFSQPPAPPPQQPLPEKPDSAGAQGPLSSPKPNLSPKNDASSSQILSLAEALAAARKELDSQGSKMRYLEEMLKQERKARETAEQRARILMEQSRSRGASDGADEEMEVAIGAEGPLEPASTEDSDRASVKSFASDDTIMIGTDSSYHTPDVPRSDASLQERLTLVLVELDEMKQQMEVYKRRAETAEEERSTLAEMVTRIRQENAAAAAAAAGGNTRRRSRSGRRGRSGDRVSKNADSDSAIMNGSAHYDAPEVVGAEKGPGLAKSATMTQEEHDALNGSGGKEKGTGAGTGTVAAPSKRQLQLLSHALASAFDGDPRFAQAAPYASILGVVLIGVGIMAYLNGWQGRTER